MPSVHSISMRDRTTLRSSSLIRAIAPVLIVTYLATCAFQRNTVWHTYLSLWEDTVRKTPLKSRVRNSLGNTYMLLGRYPDAVREYRAAIFLDQQNYESYYNLATMLEKLGLEPEAGYYYGLFCKMAPHDYPEAVKAACERSALIGQGSINR